MVAGLHVCDTLADGFDNAGTLMAQDNGEVTLGVLSRQSVGIFADSQYTITITPDIRSNNCIPVWQTPVW